MEKDFIEGILNAAKEISDENLQSWAYNFLQTFFNRKSEGNRALLLGIDDDPNIEGDKTLIYRMMGTNLANIIKKDVHYLLHVDYDKKKKMTVNVTFAKKLEDDISEGTISDNDKDSLTKFISKYVENGEKILWDLTNRLPDEVKIKDTCTEDFLINPDTNFRVLDGDRYISKVYVKTPRQRSKGVYNSIKELFVITENYLGMSQKEPNSDAREFWTEIYGDSENVFNYNYVILNTINDPTMQKFTDLFDLYQEEYNIDEDHKDILQRVFYLSGANDYTKSRYKKLPDNIHKDATDFDSDEYDVILTLQFLSILDKMIFNLLGKDTTDFDQGTKVERFIKASILGKDTTDFDLGTTDKLRMMLEKKVQNAIKLFSSKK